MVTASSGLNPYNHILDISLSMDLFKDRTRGDEQTPPAAPSSQVGALRIYDTGEIICPTFFHPYRGSNASLQSLRHRFMCSGRNRVQRQTASRPD
jgi:hypothetical protein